MPRQKPLAARNPRICRQASKRSQCFLHIIAKGQRHQPGSCFSHLQAELLRDPVSEAGCPHFRDRLATTGHNQIVYLNGLTLAGLLQLYLKPGIDFSNTRNRSFKPQLCSSRTQLVQQHPDDLLGTVIAKQLPQCLVMVGDAMPLHQLDEVMLRVPAQR
jgi:hypothetical protein